MLLTAGKTAFRDLHLRLLTERDDYGPAWRKVLVISVMMYNVEGALIDSALPLGPAAAMEPGIAELTIIEIPTAPTGGHEWDWVGPRAPGRPMMAETADGFIVRVGDLLEALIDKTGTRAEVWLERDLTPQATARLLTMHIIPLALSRHPGELLLRGIGINLDDTRAVIALGTEGPQAWVRARRSQRGWHVNNRRLAHVLSAADDFGVPRAPLITLPVGTVGTEVVAHAIALYGRGDDGFGPLVGLVSRLAEDIPVHQVRCPLHLQMASIEAAMELLT